MKKLLLTALTAALLVLPLSPAALADHEEAPVAPDISAEEYVPGGAPAQIGPADAMSPALHGLVLAMINHDAQVLDLEDHALVWEGLYNMLSLYGQLDSRSETLEDALLLPSETVQDYTAALGTFLADLGPLPQELGDRLTYDGDTDLYQVACGSDDLSQLQVRELTAEGDGFRLTGALVYLVDGTELAQFEATLQIRDNMFGYTVTQLTVS